MKSRTIAMTAVAAAAIAASATAQDQPADASAAPPQPNQQMQAVLDKLTELGAEPIGTASVEATRAAPTPADAVEALMAEEGIAPDPAVEAVKTRDFTIPGAAGPVPARLYTPAEGEGPFPVVVYFHGGGWVIADIDTYDASARQLAAGADAIVVSVDYRHAPEHKFPAAHEDAVAAYAYIVENSGALNGDADRMAVAGESAGGNLAANVAIAARDRGWTEPVHQLLVYPVAGNDMTTESYQENADAAPLGKAGMEWFVEQVFASEDQTSDPRLNLVGRDDLEGLPPATIINAEIDPLLTEGETFAQRLQEAGIEVNQVTYEGVAHEFFGMGAVVDTAREAMEAAVADLRDAFAGTEERASN